MDELFIFFSLKFYSFQRRYFRHYGSNKGLQGTVVNWVRPPLNGDSLEITITVPLSTPTRGIIIL